MRASIGGGGAAVVKTGKCRIMAQDMEPARISLSPSRPSFIPKLHVMCQVIFPTVDQCQSRRVRRQSNATGGHGKEGKEGGEKRPLADAQFSKLEIRDFGRRLGEFLSTEDIWQQETFCHVVRIREGSREAKQGGKVFGCLQEKHLAFHSCLKQIIVQVFLISWRSFHL